MSKIDPKSLDDEELLLTHAELHSYYKEVTDLGRRVEGWRKSEIIAAHDDVRTELINRGLPHQELGDDLDGTHAKPVELEAKGPSKAALGFLTVIADAVQDGQLPPTQVQRDDSGDLHAVFQEPVSRDTLAEVLPTREQPELSERVDLGDWA